MNMLRLSLQAIFHHKPEIKKTDVDINGYDLIIITSPVWANNICPPLNSYIENNDFENKNVAVVVTTDPRRSTDHTFHDYNHKISARGGTVVQEDFVPVVKISEENIINNTKEVVERLKPLIEIDALASS